MGLGGGTVSLCKLARVLPAVPFLLRDALCSRGRKASAVANVSMMVRIALPMQLLLV